MVTFLLKKSLVWLIVSFPEDSSMWYVQKDNCLSEDELQAQGRPLKRNDFFDPIVQILSKYLNDVQKYSFDRFKLSYKNNQINLLRIGKTNWKGYIYKKKRVVHLWIIALQNYKRRWWNDIAHNYWEPAPKAIRLSWTIWFSWKFTEINYTDCSK